MCNNTFCLQVLVQLDTLQMILIVLMKMNVWPTMDMVLVRILAPIQKAACIVHVKVCQALDWHQIKRLVKKLINQVPGYNCECNVGYEYDGTTCVDKNECMYQACGNGDCTNTDGRYQCKCHEGYSITSDGTCQGTKCKLL